MDAAIQALRQALTGDAPAAPAGRICIIDGAGPADLLSLRASRALSLAETLIADPDCAPGVLGLVRRDAHRLSPDKAGVGEMIALARTGAQVVRLVATPPDPTMLDALMAAGVAVEHLRAAVP
jgi:precorrin-2 dehydrogenase/sirohydrochlorin ferrochelatase